MSGEMMEPKGKQEITEISAEQVAGILFHVEQLMQGMAGALSAMDRRMQQLERQIQMLTPITGAQEKAIGAQIKQRAEELRKQYKLDASALAPIANAIRKDLKLSGGVNAIRELPRVEYSVYIERIVLWDDFRAMRAIRKKGQANP